MMGVLPRPGNSRSWRGKHLILVVGIGRSGTSAFTWTLKEFGYAVPQPEVAPNDTNPRGFAEPRWAVVFHKNLLARRSVGNFDGRPGAWEQTAKPLENPRVVERLRTWVEAQFRIHDAVVVKDPRTVWFLPLWLAVADDLGIDTSFVTMLRPPSEVISSASKWYSGGRNEVGRLAGWLNVMLRAEQITRGRNRVFASYPSLLGDWRNELAWVDRTLRLGLPLDDADAAARVDEWLDPTLRRQHGGLAELTMPPRLRSLVERAWTAFESLHEDAQGKAVRRELDALWTDYVELYTESEQIVQSSIAAAAARRAARAGSAGRTGEQPAAAGSA
jgi:hypothetical protein